MKDLQRSSAVTEPAISSALYAALTEAARACRILEMEGHGDMTLGHFSLRNPDKLKALEESAGGLPKPLFC
jgi:hypothetical protein